MIYKKKRILWGGGIVLTALHVEGDSKCESSIYSKKHGENADSFF